jgi:hypothetical protein
MSAPISNQNGTTSALTIGTETFLGSDITSAGTYQLFLNISNLANGSTPDILELRVYSEVLSGDTSVLMDIWTFYGASTTAIIYTPIYPIVNEIKFSLTQTQGTGRTFKWNIVQMS